MNKIAYNNNRYTLRTIFIYLRVRLDLKMVGDYLNQEEPLTVLIDYEMRWMKNKIEMRELAKFRDSGMTLREISRSVGLGKSHIGKLLRRYKRCVH